MPARWIVELIDVVRDIDDCGLSSGVDPPPSALLLEAAEEELGDRIVPAVAPAVHPRLKMIGFAESPPGIAAVLRPLTRVDYRFSEASLPNRLPDRFQDQLLVVRWTCRPADHLARQEIDGHGEVEPVLPCADVGDIGKKKLEQR